MRDRNHLNLQQFNIQLAKSITSSSFFLRILEQEKYFSHKTCLWRSDTKSSNSTFQVLIPKDYRLTRALVISFWYFPENLRYLYQLQLEEQTFSHFNEKQRLEISILLSSKENCEKYLFLTRRYSGSEIFGNILGNDLKDLSKNIKLRFQVQGRAKKKVFRRGPKDKGSRRSDFSIRVIEEEQKKDVWLAEIENCHRRREILLLQTKYRIQLILENYVDER